MLLTFLGNAKAYGYSGVSFSSVLNNPSNFLNADIANAASKTLGNVLDHRAFEPATPLGTQPGLDFGISVNAVQMPDILTNALSDKGFSDKMPPIFPNISELNLHKGLGDSVDVGGSILSFQGFLIWAVDLKIVFVLPDEEGLTWAFRISRTSAHIPVGTASLLNTDVSLGIDTVTWTPELVLSKKLEFADPYFGMSYRFINGAINISDTAGVDIPGFSSVRGSARSAFAFLGLSIHLPNTGLRITLEGAYNPDGFNSIGAKAGFSL